MLLPGKGRGWLWGLTAGRAGTGRFAASWGPQHGAKPPLQQILTTSLSTPLSNIQKQVLGTI